MEIHLNRATKRYPNNQNWKCPANQRYQSNVRIQHINWITKHERKIQPTYSSKTLVFSLLFPKIPWNFKILIKIISFFAWYKNQISCQTCELPFLSAYKLYCHTKEVHLVQPFKCVEAKCVESYGTQEQLNEHIQQSHSRINCPHCNKLIKLYYLPLHIKFFHDKDQRIVCDLCGHVSKNINTHKSHVRLVHEQQERLQCDICKDW